MVGCGINQELICNNYCRDAIYHSGFSGVVRNIETKERISGAIVILTESDNQMCDDICVKLGTITLITDENGWFRVPPEIRLPDIYVVNVVIEAENCVHYSEDHEAILLVGTPLSPGNFFELSCS